MIEVLNISVLALRKSAKRLFQAFALILFLASIFILLGKQLYKGVLTQKCVASPPLNISHHEYAVFVANSSNWLSEKNGYFLCGNGTGSRKCPFGYICLQGAEIDSFYSTNFNFYGSSVVSISQLMTLHFWQELYQRMLLTVGSLHVTYFVMAFYTFLYLNGLILAIITRSYKVVLMELNASDKTATLAVKDNVNRVSRSKSIVKSPSCKSYDLFVTQVKSNDKSETVTIDTLEQLQTMSTLDFEATTTQSSETLRSQTPGAKTIGVDSVHSSKQNRQLGLTMKNCLPLLKNRLQRLLISSYLEGLFLMSIAINSSIIAIHNSDMTPTMEKTMKLAYFIFAIQTVIEILIKLVAFGPCRCFADNWNKFDFTIIIAAGLEMVLSDRYYFILFLRFLKLGQLFQKTRCVICHYLTNAMCSILIMFSHPGVLLIVFVTICIVSGMQMYGTEYFHSLDRFPEQDSPRWFFQDCYSSFLLVFCMLCGDWKQPMVHAIFFTSYASNLLMLLFVLVGNLVVMNLFSALVFYTFYYQSFSPFSVLEKKAENTIQRIFSSLRGSELKTSELTLNSESKSEEKSRIEKPIATSVSQEIINKNLGKDVYSRSTKKVHGFQRMNREFEIVEDTSSEYMDDCCPNLCYYCCSFCKPDDNPVLWQAFTDLRCRLYCLVETRLFRIIIGIIIIASVVILIVEKTYGEDYPVVMKVLRILEPIVIVLFIVEMFLKWTAYGLHKYFKSPLGRLEFVIILVYMADLLTIQFFDGQKNIFKSLRAFRLLSVVQLLSSYQEVPPLPLKRNSCALGSENASRESLLHLKKLECDHFLVRHCRYRPTAVQHIYTHDSVQIDWKRNTVYTPQQRVVTRRRSKRKAVPERDKTSPVVEIYDCLPATCYCDCLRKNSLILRKWRAFRQCVARIVKSTYFFSFVLFVVILSSAFLILEILGVLSSAIIAKIAFYADKSFAALFAFIMVLRWLGIGWKQYFSRPWCLLEFIVTTVSLTYVVLKSANIVNIPALKITRIIYLLFITKALKFNKQSQMLLKSLGKAIPAYIVALCLCLFFWMVYAVFGVFMFVGMFQHCYDNEGAVLPSDSLRKDIDADSREICLMDNFTYKTSVVNYDNVGNAYIALLQVATLQNWLSLVTEIMDNCHSVAQRLKYQIYTSMYFPSFIMISTYLTLNFFVGCTLYFFNKFKKESKKKYTDETQKLYYAAVRKMRRVKLQKAVPQPMLPFQKFVYRMVTSDNFEIAGFVFIGLHMLLIALDMYDPDPSEMFALAMLELNVFFIIFFTVEWLLKLIAMRQYFFIQLWNVFDTIVLALCILGALFEENISVSPMLPAMLRILRFLKAPRYLRRHARGVLPLIATLYRSFPAMFSICILQFLIMCIYAVFGVYLFKEVKHKWDISGDLNFRTFTQSMLLLFQLSTLAGWKNVLGSLSDEAEATCPSGNHPHSDCNNWTLSVLYIVSYLLIVYYIVVKTHLIIVMENYECSMEEMENILFTEDYEMFTEIWQKFDRNGTGILQYCKLSDLLDAMEEPFHFDKPNRFFIVSLNVPIYEGELVFYGDVMDALTRDFMASNGHTLELPQNLPKLLDKSGRILKKVSSSLWRQRQNHCAHVIQNAWKRYNGELEKKECPVFYSEVRLASHSEKIDTFLASNYRFSSHASHARILHKPKGAWEFYTTIYATSCYGHTFKASHVMYITCNIYMYLLYNSVCVISHISDDNNNMSLAITSFLRYVNRHNLVVLSYMFHALHYHCSVRKNNRAIFLI